MGINQGIVEKCVDIVLDNVGIFQCSVATVIVNLTCLIDNKQDFTGNILLVVCVAGEVFLSLWVLLLE